MRSGNGQRMLSSHLKRDPGYEEHRREHNRRGIRKVVAAVLLAGLAMNAAAEEERDTRSNEWVEVSSRCKRTSEVAGPRWTQAEHWLWIRVCSGKNSDLRSAKHGDPKIRPEVLREIVTRATSIDPVTHKRIGILGMHVPGPLDLSDADIDRALIIAESKIDGGLLLDRVRTGSVLSFGGSSIGGPIKVYGAEIGGSLILRKARFDAIEINSSEIQGTVDLDGAHVRDNVEIDRSAISGSISIRNGRYGAVRLRSTSVGGQISLQDVHVEGQLDIQEVHTPESVLLGGRPFGEIRIVGSNIGGTLSLDGSTVVGATLIESNSIGRGLLARHATFRNALDLTLNRIKGNIDLRGSRLAELDLSETHADKALQLASDGQEVEWTEVTTPRISLHQTRVGSLQDVPSVWPDRLERELDGFTYKRFGGLQSVSTESGYDRTAEWLIQWIEADKSYSPQPYEHLAKVLDAVGQHRKADRIRVANRDRERSQYPIASIQWIWLGIQKLVVGYGYGIGPFRLLVGLVVIAVLGTFAAARGTKLLERRRKVSWGNCFWYSLDTAVPVLRLREEPYDEPWNGWIKVYFYVHRIAGYVIALWLVAVLTRLVG